MSIYPRIRHDIAGMLSEPRLAVYKIASDGKLSGALRLYAWNLEISNAFFSCIHYFEVGLRNEMDSNLSQYAAAQGASDSWFEPSAGLLAGGSPNKVKQAKNRVTDSGKPLSHGRVIAELPLGFWWTLLDQSYETSLWKPTLHHVFVPGTKRKRLHEQIDKVRELRNRIAHHEPLHSRHLLADYDNLLRTAERVSPSLAWWIDSTSQVSGVLDRKPPTTRKT